MTLTLWDVVVTCNTGHSYIRFYPTGTNYATAKKFYTALFPPCMAYKLLHRSTLLRKHCASLWSKVNQCKAFHLKLYFGHGFSSWLNNSQFVKGKIFVRMFAYDHNHVAVLVCGRFGRHSSRGQEADCPLSALIPRPLSALRASDSKTVLPACFFSTTRTLCCDPWPMAVKRNKKTPTHYFSYSKIWFRVLTASIWPCETINSCKC